MLPFISDIDDELDDSRQRDTDFCEEDFLNGHSDSSKKYSTRTNFNATDPQEKAIDYSPLINIKDMDFREMRAMKTETGKSASLKAITDFVKNLNVFFAQFKHREPTHDVYLKYLDLMNEITEKINLREYEYFLDIYSETCADLSKPTIVNMAQANRLTDFNKIPSRMQFWAASYTYGDAIRNSSEHIKAVQSLQVWSSVIEKLGSVPQTNAVTRTNIPRPTPFWCENKEQSPSDDLDIDIASGPNSGSGLRDFL